jgi:hypothetical protein
MAEVLIAYQRPTGLSDDDLRSWLVGHAGPSMSVRLESADTQNDRGIVRVKFEQPSQPSIAQDAIDRLLGDMRMLGLQPLIVASL